MTERVIKVEMCHDVKNDMIQYSVDVPGEFVTSLENAVKLTGLLYQFLECVTEQTKWQSKQS